MEREASLQNLIFQDDSLRYLKDCKSQARGEAGEGEDDGGDDVEDGQLGGVPVGQGPAGVEDQPKVGQVVADALCLHLVAPLNHHLVEIELCLGRFCPNVSPHNPHHSKVVNLDPNRHNMADMPHRPK